MQKLIIHPVIEISISVFLLIFLLGACDNAADFSTSKDCEPTTFDEIGPFYRPNAPMRNKVGEGYTLKGRVLSSGKCTPVPMAKLEFWLVNSEGEYDANHRATVIAGPDGNFTFESNRPTDYVGRLPHIHIRVTAQGYEELITQQYPKDGDILVDYDIVLSPVSK